MIVVVSVSLLAILLTYLDSCGKLSNGMFYGFLFITFLGCIHYNYGNDYMGYLEMYDEITRIPLRLDYLVDDVYGRDPGWVVINHLFKPFGGFFTMVAVLNIFQNIIYYKFIKANVAKNYWAFAILIYLMNSSLYILNFSMMRQGLAIALFVFSWKFLKNRRLLPALIILFVASTIHHSAQILIPFALLSIIPLNSRVVAIVYSVLIVVFYLNIDLLTDLFASLISIEEVQNSINMEFYLQTAEEDNISSLGVGFIINLIPFIVSLWILVRRKEYLDNSLIMLITISMVSFLIAPLGQIVSLIGRFGMYFEAYKIACIPLIYSFLPRKWSQALSALYILMLLYSYYTFFHSPVWMESYSTFHTIFSVL